MVAQATDSKAQLRALEQHREVLVSLRDFFLASRSAGARSCSGPRVCADCGGAMRGSMLGPCEHQALLNGYEHNHGQFTGDTNRIAAIEAAIAWANERLAFLALPAEMPREAMLRYSNSAARTGGAPSVGEELARA